MKILFFGCIITVLQSIAMPQAYLLADLTNHKVLNSHQSHKPHPPASLTKIMTLYLVFDALKAGHLKMDQFITVPAEATCVEPSKLGLKKGERMTVRNLLLALIVRSMNDAAVTLAHYLGPTEKKFSEKMTCKARELGMKQTIFKNASGLPHRQQTTTAHDMMILCQALLKNHAGYYHFFSTQSITYKGKTHMSSNTFLGRGVGVDGIKTGYTHAAKFNFIVSAIQNGRRLLAIVLGANNKRERNQHILMMLSYPGSAMKHVQEPKIQQNKAVVKQWRIQVGCYGKMNWAQKAATDLQKRYPSLQGPLIKKDKKLYRILFGPYPLHTKAAAFCHTLKKNGQDCLVVS